MVPAFLDALLVCPICDQQALHQVSGGWSDQSCPSCNAKFRLFARVRSKRSRVTGPKIAPVYSVHLRYRGIEDLVEYDGAYEEFEMKPGDIVAFLYGRNGIGIVHNLTLGRHTRFVAPATAISEIGSNGTGTGTAARTHLKTPMVSVLATLAAAVLLVILLSFCTLLVR